MNQIFFVSIDFSEPKIFFAGDSYDSIAGEKRSSQPISEDFQRLLAIIKGAKPDYTHQMDNFTSVQLKDTVDVLILGAGAAGIAAACNLAKNSSLSFLVLEGFHQHGGRIRSVPMVNIEPSLNNTVVAFAGAQWLHARSNPMYDFAVKNNLILLPDSNEGIGKFYREDGYQFDEDFADKVNEIVEDILTEAQSFYRDDIQPYPENMELFVRSKFEVYIRDYIQADKIKARQLLGWHELFQVIDWSAPQFSALSAKSWGRFKLVDDSWEYINFKEGLWGLLRDMINDIGGQQFLYNKLVTKIHWGATFVHPNGKTSKVLVKTDDGSIYAADFVIPTFSMGVLKHDTDRLFIPSLPIKHRSFIQCFGFFSISKIFLEFPYKWYEEELGFNYVYTENDSSGRDWRFWVNGFDVVYTGHENTLLGWIGGLGLYQVEALTDEEILRQVMSDLKSKFLVRSNLTIPDPTRYYISRWLTNPLTRGCYSYASTSCDALNLGPTDLLQPITSSSSLNSGHDDKAPIILFAGEATSDEYYSCAHGAYFTGAQQAQVIIAYKGAAMPFHKPSSIFVCILIHTFLVSFLFIFRM